MAKIEPLTQGYQLRFKNTPRNIEWDKQGTITLGQGYEVLDRFYERGTLTFLIADNRNDFLYIRFDTEQIGRYKP
jgi:hypothetical protein